jgi:hypothetical protein
MKDAVFDVEVAPNKAMVGFMDLKSGKVKQFQHNESKKIRKYVKKHRLIGFNSKNYDNIMVTLMMGGYEPTHIYKASKDLIEGNGKRWDYPNDIPNDIDIMEVAPGQASLKLYGARLGTKKLQDLPYDPHANHTKKMWDNVCKYNVNDLIMTKELYEYLKPQLDIRADIGKKYGIDVMSRSDAQVAEDVFKKVLKIDKKPKIDKPRFVKYKAPKYVEFKTKQLRELKDKFESTKYHINPATGRFEPQEWLKEKVVINGVDYTIGFGGLHSNEKSVSYVGDLCDIDVTGYYPSLIINSGKYPKQLGSGWLKLYEEIYNSRNDPETGFKVLLKREKNRLNELKKELSQCK